MNTDKLKIAELQKEIQELKEENQNLERMLKKQFDNSFKQIKENRTNKLKK